MTIKKISKNEAELHLKSAKKLVTTKEFSKTKKCEIQASYFQTGNSYIEVVIRKFNSLNKKDEIGYFSYDTPYPVIFALMHSCDHKSHELAEMLYREYIGQALQMSIQLPSDTIKRVEELAQKRKEDLDYQFEAHLRELRALNNIEGQINEQYEAIKKRQLKAFTPSVNEKGIILQKNAKNYVEENKQKIIKGEIQPKKNNKNNFNKSEENPFHKEYGKTP